jgi:hypothetical protein
MSAKQKNSAFCESSTAIASTFWVDAAVQLPDDDMIVLVALDDAERKN